MGRGGDTWGGGVGAARVFEGVGRDGVGKGSVGRDALGLGSGTGIGRDMGLGR